MHVTFQKVKSALYFSFWVVFVIGVPFLWSITYGYDMYHFATPLICGCAVGIISALSPARSFLAGFLGFFVTGALSSITDTKYLAPFALLGIFCGLVALACAVLRRVILRSRTEQLHLATWKWVIIVGGASIFADYLLIPGSYTAVIQFHFHQLFIEVLMAVLTGFFCLGLYAGAFYDLEYQDLIKNVLKFSLGGHSAFLLYFIFHLATGHIFWKDSFFFIVIVILTVIFFIGVGTGYRLRKRSSRTLQTAE
jgi:hypothetical protein